MEPILDCVLVVRDRPNSFPPVPNVGHFMAHNCRGPSTSVTASGRPPGRARDNVRKGH